MKPTDADLKWFLLKTLPKWAAGLKPSIKCDIDGVIESRTPPTYAQRNAKGGRESLAIHNSISLLKLHRRVNLKQKKDADCVAYMREIVSKNESRSEYKPVFSRWIRNYDRSVSRGIKEY